MGPAAEPEGDEVERFLFVHIQKTGGTTLYRRLIDQFGADAVYPLANEPSVNARMDLDYLTQAFAQRRDRIRVVTGHFPYATVERLGVGFRTFTVLREPVERTLSHLRFQKKVDATLEGWSLDAVYGRPFQFRTLIHNQMTKMLSASVEELEAGWLRLECDEGHLERAVANLHRIDVVGLQDRYDRFWGDLERRFGWDLGEASVINTTAEHTVPDGLAERIVEDNPLDVELYRYAQEHWGTRDGDLPAPGRGS